MSMISLIRNYEHLRVATGIAVTCRQWSGTAPPPSLRVRNGHVHIAGMQVVQTLALCNMVSWRISSSPSVTINVL